MTQTFLDRTTFCATYLEDATKVAQPARLKPPEQEATRMYDNFKAVFDIQKV